VAETRRTHYDVLGVPTGADAAEIRRAYLVLARRFHPDAHADRSPAERAHAERRMRDVNEAWADLSDARRREAYDAKVLRPTARPSRPAPPPGPGWRPRADDDAWMRDFGSWKAETDLLPPDPPGPRRPTRLLPPGILAVAIALACVATVLSSRPLVAVAFMLAGIAAALWIWLPLAEMARARREDPDR
jgi:hypothetical protein